MVWLLFCYCAETRRSNFSQFSTSQVNAIVIVTPLQSSFLMLEEFHQVRASQTASSLVCASSECLANHKRVGLFKGGATNEASREDGKNIYLR